MRARTLVFPCGFVVVLAAALTAHAASPDDPRVPVPPNRYGPITSGTKSYRPVEPLPWGDVNRRVMPEQKGTPQGKESAPPQPQRKH
jgi:hypothetical protein